MTVEEGTYQDWKVISQFHYRSHRIAFLQKVFVLKRRNEICGAIVYTYQLSTAPGRHLCVTFQNMKELNENLSRITRVVVHPKYRTICASVKLLKESFPKCGRKYVELIAVMARYNPFAEKAGMKKILESEVHKIVKMSIQKLEDSSFTPYLLAIHEYNLQKLEGKEKQVIEILSKLKYPYSRRVAGAHGNYRTAQYRQWLKTATKEEVAVALVRISQLNQSKVYLFWSKEYSLHKFIQ